MLSASLIFLAAPVSTKAFSGEVTQGAGSYSTTLPAGAATPQNEIYKTANVTSPMPTNDWWSSLAWVPYSEAQYPHPLALKNQQNGLRIFNPSGKITVNPGYIAGWMDDVNDFSVGHSVSASFLDAKVDGFSDWFVKSLFQSGSNKMSATYGHGSPYVFLSLAVAIPSFHLMGCQRFGLGQLVPLCLALRLMAHIMVCLVLPAAPGLASERVL